MKAPWARHDFLARRQLEHLVFDLPDAAYRRLTGRRDWPPYSLRSFVGGAWDFDRVGELFLEDLWKLGLLRRGTRILDVGCGCGRIERALASDVHLNELGVSCTGMDIDPAGVEWCQRHITPVNPRFTFYQADCRNASYNPAGGGAADAYVFPHADCSFDLILLTSVMTHLLAADLRHYLAEVSRMLAPGGVAYASFFLYESLEEAVAGAARHGTRFPYRQGDCALQRFDFPTNAVAYQERFVHDSAAEAGLEALAPTRYGVQDIVMLGKRPDRWTPAELVSGWHPLEQDQWRWTERRFAVRLRRNGSGPATLRFRFYLPEAARLDYGRLRLSAEAGGIALPDAVYDSAGEHLYLSAIPDQAWEDDAVAIGFELDRCLAPSPADWRELGVQAGFYEQPGLVERALEPFLLHLR